MTSKNYVAFSNKWEHDEAPLTEEMLTHCGKCGKPVPRQDKIHLCQKCWLELKQVHNDRW